METKTMIISQQTQRDLENILETLDQRIHELNAARRLNAIC